MNRFNKVALSIVAAVSLLAVGASSASAKPGKSGTSAYKSKSGKVVVKQGKQGKQGKITYQGKQGKHGKVVVKKKPGKVVINVGKHASKHRYTARRPAPRITAAERRQIAREQQTLARMQARFYRDGFLSRSERRALSNQQLKVQRTIARARMS